MGHLGPYKGLLTSPITFISPQWRLTESLHPFTISFFFLCQIMDLNGIADKIEILSQEESDLQIRDLSTVQVNWNKYDHVSYTDKKKNHI